MNERFSCKVCGNTPDEYGVLEHGRGCYTQSEDGGGSEYIEEAAAAPAWRDSPTVPGFYVCIRRRSVAPVHLANEVAMELTQEDLDRGAPFHTSRVYGPIPRDEKE